jgi:hypothetical protein
MKTSHAIGFAMLAVLILVGGFFGGRSLSTTSSDKITAAVVEQAQVKGSCPDNGVTAFTLDVFNKENVTGSENYDVTAYIFNKDTDTIKTVISDTTAPTAVNLDCGKSYVAKLVSTDGSAGDKSTIMSVQGDGATVVNGNIEFTTKTATLSLRAQAQQHATETVRAFDKIQNDQMFDSSDSSEIDYEASGVTFTSTVNNATASDETLGFDVELDFKAVETDADYNDRGILVLIEMPTTKWEETPSVYANGKALEKVTLTGSEKSAYTDYEYAFLIPADVVMKDGSQGFTVRVVNNLKSGITSVSADPQIVLAVRGAVLSTDGQSILEGVAVSDASTPAQIYSLFTVTVDMT